MKKSFNMFTMPLAVVSLLFMFISCGDSSVTEPLPSGVGKELMIDASSRTDWVYFSFSKGDTVTIAEANSSLEWDIGLRRYHFKTNSGTSGSSQGGVVNMGKVDFTSVTEAPESGYTVDDSVTFQGHGGPITYSLNPVLEGWAIMEGMPATFVTTDSIYVLKTAYGKYTKLWLKGYYNEESVSGHITLEYFYQPDGSRNLKE